ncbi:hypothetical protein, partial [Paraburkholderia sediminicola]|uniref:hypothetical protein n=1 Tax=Paraburkholderia sediminicola TaxID=458836 RepID=UPI0038B817AB
MLDGANEPAFRSIVQSGGTPLDGKASKSGSSPPFYQVLVFAHGRKTESSLPGHFANTFAIQQKPGGKSPALCERNIVYLFAHRPEGKSIGCYVALRDRYLYTIQDKSR